MSEGNWRDTFGFGRSEIRTKLVCSICGEILEVDLCDKKDQKISTRVGANNAYECYLQVAIKPCRHCWTEAQKPSKLLKEVITIANKQGIIDEDA